jgi:hypothetical protein
VVLERLCLVRAREKDGEEKDEGGEEEQSVKAPQRLSIIASTR